MTGGAPTQETARVSPHPIEGVKIHYPETHADERGELSEAWRTSWGLHPDPVAMVVFATIRAGQSRGWVAHRRQDDRTFIGSGSAKIVLYDDRAESPTRGRVNVLHLGEERPGVLTIPAGVYHAIQNIGERDLVFIDMPNRVYDPRDPDTSRVPLDSDLIPYRLL